MSIHKLPFQPSQGSFGSLFYALGLNVECQNESFVLHEPSSPQPPKYHEHHMEEYSSNTWFVDWARGADSGSGDIGAPFKTLQRAMQESRRAVGPSTIVMRNGTHFINETIEFTPEDSYLTIQACGVVLLSMHLVDRVFRTILARRRF